MDKTLRRRKMQSDEFMWYILAWITVLGAAALATLIIYVIVHFTLKHW